MRKIKGVIVDNKITRFLTKTKRRKALVVVFLVLIALNQVNNSRKPDFELDVVVVKKTTLDENISASGKVEAEKMAELAFLSSENIKEIVVEDGSYLKKGDLIAKLDSTSIYQSYLQAESNLRSAEAALNSIYDSLQGKEKDETFAEISTRTSAEVARDNAYRSYVIAQKSLSNSNLRAPFDGFINYNEGTSIGKLSTSMSPSFTIVDPNTVFFSAEINEIDIPRVKPGTPAVIELDAYPSDTYYESVKSVGYVSTFTSTGGTAYKIRISLPENKDNKFRIGMNGDIELILSSKKDVVSIPQSAISESDGISYVWVLGSDSKVKRVEVKTGVSSTDDIEIINGLNSGETIVERPPSAIEEGNRIKPIMEGTTKKKILGIF